MPKNKNIPTTPVDINIQNSEEVYTETGTVIPAKYGNIFTTPTRELSAHKNIKYCFLVIINPNFNKKL